MMKELIDKAGLTVEERNEDPEKLLKVLQFQTQHKYKQKPSMNSPELFYRDPIKRLISFKGKQSGWGATGILLTIRFFRLI
jgi:hypothetical protein